MKLETERKFLIVRPDDSRLAAQPGLTVREIVQTYLTAPEEEPERRIRRITEDGRVSFVFTQKANGRKIGSAVSREETEYEISPAEYDTLRRTAYSELTKTRYSFPCGERVIEIDVYPDEIGGEALSGKAVLEVELEDGNESVSLPPWITVLRELTGTKKFSNKALARRVRP